MTLPIAGPVRLEKMDDLRWRIPREGPMRVDGIVYGDEALVTRMREDKALEQVRNVACLPGLAGPSLGMPDLHWGYGFPIGGVAAFDPDDGVISPGGIGFDINCGVRLLASDLPSDVVAAQRESIANALDRAVPSGAGGGRDDLVLSNDEMEEVLTQGARWAVARGTGSVVDLDHTEENGRLDGADPSLVSATAKSRARDQVGTLGSGNHFLEVDRVAHVYDETAAEALGLRLGATCVLIHCGSRGLGHQVCTDFLPAMRRASAEAGIELPDPQLACAPFRSAEGRRYFGAMRAAVNFAFANRQVIADRVRKVFLGAFGDEGRLRQVYDVCHNIAKVERHLVDGRERDVVVHRKGATRAFPPGHPLTPAAYRAVGQPVIVPGDMGRYSFVLVGTEGAWRNTFGSCCHGAGRVQSRTKAKAATRGRNVRKELADKGIALRAASRATIDEEHPEAYKDVADVVAVVHGAGLARLVARLEPFVVVKG
jgi:tRNA-splicing ligase RtcB (3'-phosphate/5'-hydroxy nucleic acid ligase)